MKWVSAFKYLPVEYDATLAVIENRTQRVVFRNNINGHAVRILLSNKMGQHPLTIEHMTVGIAVCGRVRDVTEVRLHGDHVLRLAPGAEVFSDELLLDVHPGDQIAVSSYIKDRQNIESVCCYWSRSCTEVTLNHDGDATDGTAFSPVPHEYVYEFVAADTTPDKASPFYGFSAVQIFAAENVQVIAAFGDSITHMSYVTDELCKQLYRQYSGQVALINCGIGGNRLLTNATYIREAPAQGRLFGPAGISRFAQDIYSIDTVDTIIALEGINDIMHPIQFEGQSCTTTPEALAAGYTQIADIAHAHGSRIFGATITPCGNSDYPAEWMNIYERTRQPVNDWLRRCHPYDGLLDYDAGVRNPANPGYMKKGFSIGDGLHPNQLGARRMVDQIDLQQLIHNTVLQQQERKIS